ncbi:MAG: DMT family transporter [Promethearchaeota archaeon]
MTVEGVKVKNSRLTYIQLTSAAALWGTTFAISQVLLLKINVFALITLRMVFGLVTMIIFLAVTKKLGKLLPMFKQHTKWLFLVGSLTFALPYIIQYFALPLTTTINQAILLNFQAFFVILINKFHYKFKTSAFVYVGAILGIIGVIIIHFKDNFALSLDNMVGDLLTIVACFFYGAYTSFTKPFCEDEENDPIILNTILILIATCVLLPLAFLTPAGFINLGLILPGEWVGAIYLGSVGISLTFLLWLNALKKVDSSKVAIFVFLEPVFATMISMFFLKTEPVTPFLIVGMCFCLVGVWIAQRDVGNKKIKLFSRKKYGTGTGEDED